MKRRTLNIILSLIILLSTFGNVITIINIKKNLSLSTPGINDRMKMQEPPTVSTEKPPSMEVESPDQQEKGDFIRKNTISLKHILLIFTFSALISLSVTYILMNFYDAKFYKNKDRFIIYILSNIILIYLIVVGSTMTIDNYKKDPFKEESAPKDEVELDKKQTISPGKTDLSNYDTDVTITKGGTYELKGLFTNSIIIDAETDEVELVLAGVNITTEDTATIVGLSAKTITIALKEGTENTLTDGGNSEYDGCIYSEAELIFKGTGKLTVNGNQKGGEGIATEAKNITIEDGTYVIKSNDDGINAGGDGATIAINGGIIYIDAEGDGIDSNKDAIINGGTIFVMGAENGGDAGIDTDDGYRINGGKVIALGSDMLETPKKKSKQNSIAFVLDERIERNTLVTLMKKDKVIVSFEAPKRFKTLIISDKTLTDGEYELYINGTHTGTKEYEIYTSGLYTKGEQLTIGGIDTFTVSNSVNTYGKK